MRAPFRRIALRGALLLASLLANATTSCGGDFDPASRITSLRVIAVAADLPYAHPGEEVALKALWFDPATRARTWAWTYCVDPDQTTVLGCIRKLVADSQDGQTPPPITLGIDRDTFKLKIPTDAISRLPSEARGNASVGVLTVVCPGTLAASFESMARNELPITCTDPATKRRLASEEFVIGIKRIFLRERDRNANPVVKRVTWDGADWPEQDVKEVSACDTTENRYDRCKDAEHHDVALELTPESFETGVDEFGVSFTEQLIEQYYATEGLFEHDVRIARDPPTAWAARKKASGQTVGMWLVGRDNRGGVVWAERKVKVR